MLLLSTNASHFSLFSMQMNQWVMSILFGMWLVVALKSYVAAMRTRKRSPETGCLKKGLFLLKHRGGDGELFRLFSVLFFAFGWVPLFHSLWHRFYSLIPIPAFYSPFFHIQLESKIKKLMDPDTLTKTMFCKNKNL